MRIATRASTSRTTRVGALPIAIRMPISVRRRFTAYALAVEPKRRQDHGEQAERSRQHGDDTFLDERASDLRFQRRKGDGDVWRRRGRIASPTLRGERDRGPLAARNAQRREGECLEPADCCANGT